MEKGVCSDVFTSRSKLLLFHTLIKTTVEMGNESLFDHISHILKEIVPKYSSGNNEFKQVVEHASKPLLDILQERNLHKRNLLVEKSIEYSFNFFKVCAECEAKLVICAAETLRQSLVNIFKAQEPKDLVEFFKKHCSNFTTLQIIVQERNADLLEPETEYTKMLMQNMKQFLSNISMAAKLKFSYPEYLEFQSISQLCYKETDFYLKELLVSIQVQKSDERVLCPLIDFAHLRNCATVALQNESEADDFLKAIADFGFLVSNQIKQPLRNRIVESCTRISEHQIDSTQLGNNNYSNDSDDLIGELETLEKLINMAVLRLGFDLSTQISFMAQSLLKDFLSIASPKDSAEKCPNLYGLLEDLAKLESHVILVVQLVSSCSNNQLVSKQLNFTLRELILTGRELRAALESNWEHPGTCFSIYYLQMTENKWRLILGTIREKVLSILDATGFLKLTDVRLQELTNEIDDLLIEGNGPVVRKLVNQVLRYSIGALTRTRYFVESKEGRNSRKAIKMASDQVVCAIRTVKLSFQKYSIELGKGEEDTLVTFLNILSESMTQLYSAFQEADCSIFQTDTASQTGEDVEPHFSLEDWSQSPESDESLFELTNILEGLSGTGSELNATYISNLSKMNVTFKSEGSVDRRIKSLLAQTKNLDMELRKAEGCPFLLMVSKELCSYIIQVLSWKPQSDSLSLEQENRKLQELFKRSICEAGNTKVLYALSCLMQYFELVVQQSQVVSTHVRIKENSARAFDTLVCKVSNLLVKLIETLDSAETEAIVLRNGNTIQ